jgi:hypothetical protein
MENLCNTVIANAASRTLAKFRSRTDTRTKFSSSTLEELAQHERQALKELKIGGVGVLSLRHVHGYGHHSNGARKLRHSIRAKLDDLRMQISGMLEDR